jgi:tetratricopeptide (TPR) repeat protein
MGNHDGVIKDFTEVIRLAPAVGAYTSRASGYSAKCKEARAAGDKSGFFEYWDREIKDYEAALQLDPNDGDVQKMLELAISEREHRKQAYDSINEL